MDLPDGARWIGHVGQALYDKNLGQWTPLQIGFMSDLGIMMKPWMIVLKSNVFFHGGRMKLSRMELTGGGQDHFFGVEEVRSMGSMLNSICDNDVFACPWFLEDSACARTLLNTSGGFQSHGATPKSIGLPLWTNHFGDLLILRNPYICNTANKAPTQICWFEFRKSQCRKTPSLRYSFRCSSLYKVLPKFLINKPSNYGYYHKKNPIVNLGT